MYSMTMLEVIQAQRCSSSSEGTDSALASMLCASKGDRSVTPSNHLLQRCELGRLLIEMQASSNSAHGDVGPAARSKTGGQGLTLSLDALPRSVSADGITVLDAWAREEAEAEEGAPQPSAVSSKRRRQKWLPEFVVAHAEQIHLAARAADFLGCEAFLELFTQLQVLRVSMAGGAVLGQLARIETERRRGEEQEARDKERRKQGRGRGRGRWWWEEEWGQRWAQPWNKHWRQLRGQQGEQERGQQGGSAGDHPGTSQTSAIEVSAMLPKLSTLSKETIRTHLPLLLDDPPLYDDSSAGDEGDDDNMFITASEGVAGMAAGSGGGASCSSFTLLASPPPGPWSTARQDVPVHWVEAVAALLPYTDLLPYQVTSTQHLRYLLTASGLEAACYVECREAGYALTRQGKELFVGLDLTALPESVRQGYVAVGVEVEAEGHDEFGNRSEDYGTYRNCRTWNELVVVRVAGDSPRTGGRRTRDADGGGDTAVPVREGEPGRLFMHLNGVYDWQQHHARLGPTSQVVRDLNTHVFVAPARGAAGQQQQQAGSAAAGGSESALNTGGSLESEQQQQQQQQQQEEVRQQAGGRQGEGEEWGAEEDDKDWDLGGGDSVDGWPLALKHNNPFAEAHYYDGERLRHFWHERHNNRDRLGSYVRASAHGSRAARGRALAARVPPPRYQLRLLQCAIDTENGRGGIQHYMRWGSIVLELRARRA